MVMISWSIEEVSSICKEIIADCAVGTSTWRIQMEERPVSENAQTLSGEISGSVTGKDTTSRELSVKENICYSFLFSITLWTSIVLCL